MFPSRIPFPQILLRNQSFSTNLILTTSFHRLLEHWKVWRREVKHRWIFFLDIKTTVKNKLGSILEKLTQRHNRREHARFDNSQDVCDNEICTSTQLLQMPKKSINWSSRITGTLPVFGFNSAKYDLNLMKSYLLPILVNERDIEPTVIKEAKQFISFKFGDF